MKLFGLLRDKGYFDTAYELNKMFDEFNNTPVMDIEEKLRCSDMRFYEYKLEPVPVWMRFTLPFALVMWVLMFAFLPINFMINGKWGYEQGGWIYNWFKSLGFEG